MEHPAQVEAAAGVLVFRLQKLDFIGLACDCRLASPTNRRNRAVEATYVKEGGMKVFGHEGLNSFSRASEKSPQLDADPRASVVRRPALFRAVRQFTLREKAGETARLREGTSNSV